MPQNPWHLLSTPVILMQPLGSEMAGVPRRGTNLGIGFSSPRFFREKTKPLHLLRCRGFFY